MKFRRRVKKANTEEWNARVNNVRDETVVDRRTDTCSYTYISTEPSIYSR